MSPKIIAHYLPQFHDVTENNTWWGDGFTEWTNVKKSLPLYTGHAQPRIPLDSNYYDILDRDTRAWQAKIAKTYGIDGFCYYHYWFQWWKKLLEKPMESFLKDWEPNIPFCFSWGNGNWARTWEWQPEQILMHQEYGDEHDWRTHFDYLLPFFQSDLYMRKEGKPVFLIHYSKHMKDIIDPMMEKWNEWISAEGIPGLYIIETISSSQKVPYSKYSAAVVEHQPLHVLKNTINIKTLPMIMRFALNRLWKRVSWKGLFVNTVSYSTVWWSILKKSWKGNPLYAGKDFLYSGFVNWDNSPRKWRDSLIITDGSPEKFWTYFWEQYQKACDDGQDLIFLNAWNEWAEGAYLEPDEQNGYWYLSAIKEIKLKYKV